MEIFWGSGLTKMKSLGMLLTEYTREAFDAMLY